MTGIPDAMSATGMEIEKAAIAAARVNRLAEFRAHPKPATQISEIISQIPGAVREILSGKEGGKA